MSVIDDERLTLARIAELWSRECGVPEDTIRWGLANIAHQGSFEFRVPHDLIEHSRDVFFQHGSWYQSGLTDESGARIRNAMLRYLYVKDLAELPTELRLESSKFHRSSISLNTNNRNSRYLNILEGKLINLVSPIESGYTFSLLGEEIRAWGTTPEDLLLKYLVMCNEEPQKISEFRDRFYDELAKRISVDRDAFLHWVRLQRPSPGETVELPDPTFWGDIGSDRPVDWLQGIPGHEDNRAGLTLGEALKRYSDPHEWAEYEARIAPDRPSDEQAAHGLYAALITNFERHLHAGRLVALAYVEPITLDAQPQRIPPDKLPLARFDYEHSTASLGDMELVGIKVYPAGTVTGSTPDPYRTGLPGRPTISHLIMREFERRVAAGEMLPSLAEEAEALHAWAAREHPGAPPTTIRTIKNNVRSAHRRYTQGPARN